MMKQGEIERIPGLTGQEASDGFRTAGGFAWSRRLAAELGEVCRTTYFGRDVVMLSGEAGMRAFYDPRHVLRAGVRIDIPFISDGATPVVPALDGDAHAARKAALLQLVTPEALARYLTTLDGWIVSSLQRWEREPDVELNAALNQLSLLAMCTVITGAPATPAVAADFGETVLGLRGVEPERRLAARDRLIAWYRQLIAAQRGRSPSEAAPSMIGILVHRTTLTDVEIAAEVQHLFIGSSGIALAGCSALVALALHPEIAERVRAAAGGLGDPPTVAALQGSLVLQSFIEEVMRTAPIINTQLGRARTSFEVGGYTIPEGTLLLAAYCATNHAPAVYPQPDVFDPSRAERAAALAGQAVCPFSRTAPFSYVPFGGGSRETGHRCLGEELAYLAVGLLLVRVLRGYELRFSELEALRALPAPYMAPRVNARFFSTS